MTEEQRNLLIKDISARIPYKVKASYYGTDEEMECIDIIEGIIINNNDAEIIIGQYGLSVENVKPYLFPMSSMTEEQKKEYNSLCHYVPSIHYEFVDMMTDAIDYLIENHFDYRGLIPIGLASDATGLNIY